MTTLNDDFFEDLDRLCELFDLFYPCESPEKNRTYLEVLLKDFGKNMDLSEELKKFHAWYLDSPPSGKFYPRSKFRNWLSRSYSINPLPTNRF